jgi:polyisoprenyl-teichoic acid--peptidoglycan teichoic acid transferase
MRAWLFALTSIVLCLFVRPAAAQNIYEMPPAVWDGSRPFTLLLMGLDRRPDDYDLTYLNDVRADSMLIIRFDPVEKRIGILNIARDLFFARPDNGELVRVNTLLVLGEAMQTGYGPRFAMDTLQANLGIYIDAYAAFDFEAFIAVVDAIGGVDVDVPYNIYDGEFPDMNYRYDPLYLKAGPNHLDGYDALRYSRTRHQDSDYQRGARQLQVLTAIRQSLTKPEVTGGLLAQAPSLIASLEGHLHTNIPLELAITLGGQMMLLDTESLVSEALDDTNTYNYNGMRIPDRNQLVEVLTRVFGPNYNL